MSIIDRLNYDFSNTYVMMHTFEDADSPLQIFELCGILWEYTRNSNIAGCENPLSFSLIWNYTTHNPSVFRNAGFHMSPFGGIVGQNLSKDILCFFNGDGGTYTRKQETGSFCKSNKLNELTPYKTFNFDTFKNKSNTGWNELVINRKQISSNINNKISAFFVMNLEYHWLMRDIVHKFNENHNTQQELIFFDHKMFRKAPKLKSFRKV